MSLQIVSDFDGQVVGGGNAALEAALSAAQTSGTKVAMLEVAPNDE